MGQRLMETERRLSYTDLQLLRARRRNQRLEDQLISCEENLATARIEAADLTRHLNKCEEHLFAALGRENALEERLARRRRHRAAKAAEREALAVVNDFSGTEQPIARANEIPGSDSHMHSESGLETVAVAPTPVEAFAAEPRVARGRGSIITVNMTRPSQRRLAQGLPVDAPAQGAAPWPMLDLTTIEQSYNQLLVLRTQFERATMQPLPDQQFDDAN